jgi:hypothetical protein
MFAPVIGILLAAVGSAQAQTGNPATLPTALSPPGANSSAREIDPALNLRGMPCSVSLNATGGVTTSPSCGSDPLEVPARTIVSPAQVNGSQPLSVSTGSVTGGTQSSASAGGTNSGPAVSGNGTTAAAVNTSSSAALGTSTLCSTTVSTTGGATGVASLIGGC